jgi:hypothetical protein
VSPSRRALATANRQPKPSIHAVFLSQSKWGCRKENIPLLRSKKLSKYNTDTAGSSLRSSFRSNFFSSIAPRTNSTSVLRTDVVDLLGPSSVVCIFSSAMSGVESRGCSSSSSRRRMLNQPTQSDQTTHSISQNQKKNQATQPTNGTPHPLVPSPAQQPAHVQMMQERARSTHSPFSAPISTRNPPAHASLIGWVAETHRYGLQLREARFSGPRFLGGRGLVFAKSWGAMS